MNWNTFKLQTIRQEITGTPYEEMDGKFYVDRNGSLWTITWKVEDDDDDDDNNNNKLNWIAPMPG